MERGALMLWLVFIVYLLLPFFIVSLLNKNWGTAADRTGILLSAIVAAAPWAFLLVGGVLRSGELDPCVMWKSTPEICILRAWPELYFYVLLALIYGGGAAGAFVMSKKKSSET